MRLRLLFVLLTWVCVSVPARSGVEVSTAAAHSGDFGLRITADQNGRWLTDPSAEALARCNVDLYFRTHTLSLSEGARFDLLRLQDAMGGDLATVFLVLVSGTAKLGFSFRTGEGTLIESDPGDWVAAPRGWFRLSVRWSADDTVGGLAVLIDDQSAFSAEADTGGLVMESLSLGIDSVSDGTVSGFLDCDDYELRSSGVALPVCLNRFVFNGMLAGWPASSAMTFLVSRAATLCDL